MVLLGGLRQMCPKIRRMQGVSGESGLNPGERWCLVPLAVVRLLPGG